MASKFTLSIFTITLLLLTLFSLLSCATAREIRDKISSPFEFIEHLKGCHKGDNLKGINDLKKYLATFGYLNYKNQNHSNDNDFDDLLEEAIKTYQFNYNLNITGVLDGETVSKMLMPRCGVPDIINGTTSMHSGTKKHHHDGFGGSLHTTAHYAFFSKEPKWPPSKYHLTYGFLPGTIDLAREPVSRAFKTWAANSHFTFSQLADQNPENADLTINFLSGDHGDGKPFTGRGGALAHAFAPSNGRFHYDMDESWSDGAVPGSFDLETVALHEIGHLLGLAHSSVEGAIMFPTIRSGVTQGLHVDDVQGIKDLYNV